MPVIAPHPAGTPFFWSVMIPCYQAPEDYLTQTINSVLQQDPGAKIMQIAVVDDASPDGPPVDLIRKIAGDRVAVHCCETNLGLVGNMNRCLELAQGRWTHILHQDDVVKPGFYEKLRAGAESSASPGMAYCRHAFIDEHGQQGWLSELDALKAGCLPDALPHLARKQMIQTPSVVVRRSVYEAIGGFRSDLCFSFDWEMWCRIAKDYPVWFEPEVLASYRVHASATSRLRVKGEDIVDLKKCIDIITGYIADDQTRVKVRRAAQRRYALMASDYAEKFLAAGNPAAARRQMLGAWQCDKSIPVLKQIIRLSPGLLFGTARKTSS